MSDILVVTSKVKALIAKQNLRTAGDVSEELTRIVEELATRAAELATQAGRKTVQGQDILDASNGN